MNASLLSTGHVLELREVERLRPFETALGEHLKHRFDALGVIQAAERDEDHSWEALQVAGEHPGAAIGAEVSIKALARLGDVVKRFRLAADQRKFILGHPEETGRAALELRRYIRFAREKRLHPALWRNTDG